MNNDILLRSIIYVTDTSDDKSRAVQNFRLQMFHCLYGYLKGRLSEQKFLVVYEQTKKNALKYGKYAYCFDA